MRQVILSESRGCQSEVLLDGVPPGQRLEPVAGTEEIDRSRRRILLADADSLNREIAASILRAAGFGVDTVGDGEAACAAALDVNYDLILMNIEMPRLNGFEAAERIRASEGTTAGAIIVALTAMDRDGARKIHDVSGMDDFIARPVAARTLVQRVSLLLDPHGPGNTGEKPVWDQDTFKMLSRRLGDGRVTQYLAVFKGHLDEMAACIASGSAGSADFWRWLHDMVSVAGFLGFDDLSSLCRHVQDDREIGLRRCRVSDLACSVRRAMAAIDTFLCHDGCC